MLETRLDHIGNWPCENGKGYFDCESRSVDWEAFLSTPKDTQDLRKYTGSTIYAKDKFSRFISNCLPLQLDKQRRDRREVSTPLYELIAIAEKSLCSDPRDKIYGLLGLASHCRNGEFEADYSKTLKDIYQDVIEFYYLKSKRLQFPAVELVRLSQLLQRHSKLAPSSPSRKYV